jgi:predicted transcriptional regulator
MHSFSRRGRKQATAWAMGLFLTRMAGYSAPHEIKGYFNPGILKVNLEEIMNTMANVLDEEMFNYFTQLNEAEKKSVVQMLKTFLKGRRVTPGRISIEQYNKEIDEVMEEVKKGEVYTHEEVVKMSKGW